MNRFTWRAPTVGLLGLFALAFAMPLCAQAQCTSEEGQVPAPPALSNGIDCESWRKITNRLYEVTMKSDKIFDHGARISIRARVLFPAHYLEHPSKRYPVLYLLHGGTGSYVDWSRTKAETDADFPAHLDGGRLEELTSGGGVPSDVIFVMPEGGRAGWYSDWSGYTDGGFRPLWESYHVQQLVPWVDASFRTIGTRDSRSIAGLSMGGLGAAKYAAKHPEVFAAVGVFSGGVDITDESTELLDGGFIISNSMWLYGAAVENYGLDLANEGAAVLGYRNTHPELPAEQEELARMKDIFGEPQPVEGKLDWPDQNPTVMADKFDELRVAVYTGRSYDWWDRGEKDIARLNDNFQRALNRERVSHRFCTGVGTHSFHYWRADLVNFLHFLYDEGNQDQLACPCPDAENIRDLNPLNDFACWENWGAQY